MISDSVAVCTIVASLLKAIGYTADSQQTMSDSEIITTKLHLCFDFGSSILNN